MKEGSTKGGIRSRKRKNFGKTVKRLLQYMSSRAGWILAAFILAVFSAIFLANAPRVMGEVTTEIYRGVQEGLALRKAGETVSVLPINFDLIKSIGIKVQVMYLLAGGLRYLQQFVMVRVVQNTVYDLRRDMKRKMSRLPIRYYDTHSHGDIMSRAVNDMDQIANTLQQTLTQIMQSSVQLVTVLIVML